jgi:UDP-N-acetylmuramate--alanine ligase
MLVGLREAGITAHVGHSAQHFVESALPDVVVVSSAIPAGNPEVDRARELGVRV